MASARIQRRALILGAYDYSICHQPGTAKSHADALSLLPLPDTYKETPVPDKVILLINQLSTSIITAEKIRQWTDHNPILARVRRLVLNGCTLSDPDQAMEPYHHRCSELLVADGCILWGSRVIVPLTGHQIVLDQLYECHLGISRMKSLARCYVWWPKIDNDIEHTVQNCHTCQLHRPTPPKAPLHPWEWSRIHIDHAGPFMGHTLVIIIDAIVLCYS